MTRVGNIERFRPPRRAARSGFRFLARIGVSHRTALTIDPSGAHSRHTTSDRAWQTIDTAQLESGRLPLWGIRNPVRGLLHGVAAGLALAGAAALVIEAPSTVGRLGVVAFGAAMTALFLTSSLYHSAPWSPVAMRRMRRLDHSMIFILISATFTPFGLLTLDGWLRVSSLAAAWSLAGIGIAAVLTTSGVASRRRVGAMIGLGWLSALVAVPVGRQVGPEAVGLLAAGGVIYSAGGLIFACRWPRLWPHVFSYHELFHALVVLAALLHFVAVYHFLLPLAATHG